MEITDLSGGQWQRLALARLLYQDAPLLILDEPSASLDPVGERQIFELLSTLAREKIILFATHRYDTIRQADTIAVLVDGCLAEMGTHDELERNAREFWSLYLAQASPPVAGLTLGRTMGKIDGARFVALVDGEAVGQCECTTDLTRREALPALLGWGELSELEVSEAWHNRGIGTWLVRQAVAWHRLGGGERMILAVHPEDEDAGAGRFYQRLGWQVFVRQRKGWQWVESQIAGAPDTV